MTGIKGLRRHDEPAGAEPEPVSAGLPPGPPLPALVAARHELVTGWAAAVASAADVPERRFRWARASAALSAHCAAMQRVVYPAARSRLPDGRHQVAAQLRVVRRVLFRMRQLEQLLAGDAYGPRRSVAEVTDALHTALRAYLVAEQKFVTALSGALPPADARSLAVRLAGAQQRGATRPHPHVPQWRPLAGPAFWFNRQWDDLLDALDNRAVPAAQARQVRPLSLWGSYLTGMPLTGMPLPGETPGSADARG